MAASSPRRPRSSSDTRAGNAARPLNPRRELFVLSGAPARLDVIDQPGDGRGLQEAAQRNPYVKRVLQSGDDLHRLKGGSAEVEEAVVGADSFDGEHLAPDLRHRLLDLGLRRDERLFD